MDKIDFKITLKHLYRPGSGGFSLVDVPAMQFVMVDGQGDPNSAPVYKTAVEWLYAVSYALKFAAREKLGQDYVVPPLEGLWWADDPAEFVRGSKASWRWTMMIMAPAFITPDMLPAAAAKAADKLGKAPDSLRLATLDERQCLQILHLGSYADEAPVLRHLHDVEMPARGLAFNGHHHEIYLSDPRKTAPDKLKTILRQPVRPA